MTRRGGRRARGTLALLAGLGLVVAAASPGSAAADPEPYSSGPYAERLCPEDGVAGTLCVAHREARASLQGMSHRADAAADGRPCEQQGGLWVCFAATSLLAQRGGTTYGDTFVTPRPAQVLDVTLVAHELEHVRQWRLFGPGFSALYLREGADACSNYFEEQAGLADGGYACP